MSKSNLIIRFIFVGFLLCIIGFSSCRTSSFPPAPSIKLAGSATLSKLIKLHNEGKLKSLGEKGTISCIGTVEKVVMGTLDFPSAALENNKMHFLINYQDSQTKFVLNFPKYGGPFAYKKLPTGTQCKLSFSAITGQFLGVYLNTKDVPLIPDNREGIRFKLYVRKELNKDWQELDAINDKLKKSLVSAITSAHINDFNLLFSGEEAYPTFGHMCNARIIWELDDLAQKRSGEIYIRLDNEYCLEFDLSSNTYYDYSYVFDKTGIEFFDTLFPRNKMKFYKPVSIKSNREVRIIKID